MDIYHDKERSYEFLPSLKLAKSTNALDREGNKSKLDLANRIKLKRSLDLAANDYKISSEVGRKTDVVTWMQEYINRYQLADKRNMQGALNGFSSFLQEQKIISITFARLQNS